MKEENLVREAFPSSRLNNDLRDIFDNSRWISSTSYYRFFPISTESHSSRRCSYCPLSFPSIEISRTFETIRPFCTFRSPNIDIHECLYRDNDFEESTEIWSEHRSISASTTTSTSPDSSSTFRRNDNEGYFLTNVEIFIICEQSATRPEMDSDEKDYTSTLTIISTTRTISRADCHGRFKDTLMIHLTPNPTDSLSYSTSQTLSLSRSFSWSTRHTLFTFSDVALSFTYLLYRELALVHPFATLSFPLFITSCFFLFPFTHRLYFLCPNVVHTPPRYPFSSLRTPPFD